MLARLSSKGQLVLPKSIRQALGLGPGTVFKITCKDHSIVLDPVATSMVDRLYGKFSGADLLGGLEAEHAHEVLRENRA